ncbi:MAG: 3'(2'),5'-bisphosphate nucleotidase [Deltaproteobacteria bacterium]|nr:3'(2'),5'-bisphosphate nucleotidase [Nannocystaceae bacterium]
MDPSLDSIDAAALAAVRSAARVCRAVASGVIDAITKSDDSPVTVADFAAQAVVVHELTAALPDIVVVGEESAAVLRGDAALADAVVAAARVAWPDADRESVLAAIDRGGARPLHGPYWTLDPIDGTKGFLRRGQYAVCLARVDGDTPTLGVLGCPNLGLDHGASPLQLDPHGAVFFASAHAHVEDTIDPTQLRPCARLAAPLPAELVITHSVESGHTRIDRVTAVLERLGRAFHSLPCDSQAKYALVARGQAHAYLRIPTVSERVEMVWDHAAGAAIASAAGMCVTDLRGRAFDFSSPAGLADNFGILVAHPQIHGELVAAIAALGFA